MLGKLRCLAILVGDIDGSARRAPMTQSPSPVVRKPLPVVPFVVARRRRNAATGLGAKNQGIFRGSWLSELQKFVSMDAERPGTEIHFPWQAPRVVF